MTRLGYGAILVALLLPTGCYQPPPPTQESRADAARAAACRDRIDAIYTQQNRGEIYTDRSDMERDAPQSGGYVEGVQSRGLADRFSRDQAFSDCLREGNGPGTAPSGAAQGASPWARLLPW